MGLLRLLESKKIVHLNSTSAGGGVAEILKSLVPIEKSLGMDVSWFVLSDFDGQDNFF
jgi:trehalose synthase